MPLDQAPLVRVNSSRRSFARLRAFGIATIRIETICLAIFGQITLQVKWLFSSIISNLNIINLA
jgi:hypothetical protein